MLAVGSGLGLQDSPAFHFEGGSAWDSSRLAGECSHLTHPQTAQFSVHMPTGGCESSSSSVREAPPASPSARHPPLVNRRSVPLSLECQRCLPPSQPCVFEGWCRPSRMSRKRVWQGVKMPLAGQVPTQPCSSDSQIPPRLQGLCQDPSCCTLRAGRRCLRAQHHPCPGPTWEVQTQS